MERSNDGARLSKPHKRYLEGKVESTARRLWEWTADYEAVVAEIMDAGGELTPELEERLAQVEGAWDTKAERVAQVIRNLEAEEKLLRDEAARVVDRARVRGNAAENLRAYLLREMDRTGRAAVKTPLATIGIGESVRVEYIGDPATLPADLQRVTVKADLTAMRRAMQEGASIDGATLVSSRHVTVR